MLATIAACLLFGSTTIEVGSLQELRRAAASAKPGDVIQLKSGDYSGGIYLEGIKGLPGKPITIRGEGNSTKPRLQSGSTGLHLSRSEYVTVQNLRFLNFSANGVNVDDGGVRDKPSKGIVLDGLEVADLPRGNHDGIKLSGVQGFQIVNCRVDRWCGSGVDMVGCHDGLIDRCRFSDGGDSAVQAKGGSSNITIRRSKFTRYGSRGVNAGGSTGIEYFRPPAEEMVPGSRYEAKEIVVEGSEFVQGGAAIAFVGVDGARFSFNTIYMPEKWAIRILQETRAEGFVPSRRGKVENNLIVFTSKSWSEGGVNIGQGTDPASFSFSENWWYCVDDDSRSAPKLPTMERAGIYGQNPIVSISAAGEIVLGNASPARGVGAHSYKIR